MFIDGCVYKENQRILFLKAPIDDILFDHIISTINNIRLFFKIILNTNEDINKIYLSNCNAIYYLLCNNDKYKQQMLKKINLHLKCDKLPDTLRFLAKMYLHYCYTLNNREFNINNQQSFEIIGISENTIILRTQRDDLFINIEVCMHEDINLAKSSYILFDKKNDILGYLYIYIYDLYKLVCINKNDKLLSNNIIDIFNDRIYINTLIDTQLSSIFELFQMISIEHNINNLHNIYRVTKNDICMICQNDVDSLDAKKRSSDKIYETNIDNNFINQYDMKKYLKGFKFSDNDIDNEDIEDNFDVSKINNSFLINICYNSKKHKICFLCIFECLKSKSETLLKCPVCRIPYKIFDDKDKIPYYIKQNTNINKYIDKYLVNWKTYIL